LRIATAVVNLIVEMPLGWIYEKITDIRNAKFDRGSIAVHDLGARTISIGNITTGGTGKTPLAILVSEVLASRGERVCILTRGYGRKDPKHRVLVSNTTELLSDEANAGDEPFEMAKKLLGKAMVVADADRVAAAGWAKAEFGITVFVLDDGFQHRRAGRNVDIVCVDATDPFGGGKMLPFGRLRERVSNLKRANIILLTRADLAPDIAELKRQIAALAPGAAVFAASTRTAYLISLSAFISNRADGSTAQGFSRDPAFVFCGLGNPKAFFAQLENSGLVIAGTRAFPDHYVYGQKDIDVIVSAAKAAGADYLLTTPKDAVKLGGLGLELPCYVVNSELVLDDAERFAALL